MFSIVFMFCMVTHSSNESVFENWVESKISKYAGQYNYFEFKGSEISKSIKITIVYKNGELRAYKSDGKKSSSGIVKLEGGDFWIEGEAWSEQGSFVIRYPAPNAKGPVLKGILISDRFYQVSDG